MLTLITGHGKTKRCTQDLLPSRRIPPYLPREKRVKFLSSSLWAIICCGFCHNLFSLQWRLSSMHKAVWTGERNFTIELLQVMVTDNIPISSPWYPNIRMLSMEEIVPYTGCWFRIHVPIGRNFPQPFSRILPRRLCSCVFKSSSHHFKSVASGWWKDGIMNLKPMPCLFDCEVTSFFRSNAVLYTIAMEKVFCISLIHGFGRNIISREGKIITRISFFLQHGHDLSMIEASNVVSMLPGHLVTPVNDTLNVSVFVSAVGRLN